MPIYKVPITRTSTSTKEFEVEASTSDEARDKAFEKAHNTEFSEDGADYESGEPMRVVVDPPSNVRSISDDDICATCKFCLYNVGGLSACEKQWPCKAGPSEEVDVCASHRVVDEESSNYVDAPWGKNT